MAGARVGGLSASHRDTSHHYKCVHGLQVPTCGQAFVDCTVQEPRMSG